MTPDCGNAFTFVGDIATVVDGINEGDIAGDNEVEEYVGAGLFAASNVSVGEGSGTGDNADVGIPAVARVGSAETAGVLVILF